MIRRLAWSSASSVGFDLRWVRTTEAQPEKTFIPLVVSFVIPIFILAFAIVITQLAGLIFAQGAWIDTAYEVLARSSIIAAIAASLLGYEYYTTTGAEAND